MQRGQLLEALGEVREALQADGADLDVVAVDGTTARVRLLLGPQACEECILPKEFLTDLILMKLRECVPGLTRVELDDPRPD